MFITQNTETFYRMNHTKKVIMPYRIRVPRPEEGLLVRYTSLIFATTYDAISNTWYYRNIRNFGDVTEMTDDESLMKKLVEEHGYTLAA